jgi:hypothetical protein
MAIQLISTDHDVPTEMTGVRALAIMGWKDGTFGPRALALQEQCGRALGASTPALRAVEAAYACAGDLVRPPREVVSFRGESAGLFIGSVGGRSA